MTWLRDEQTVRLKQKTGEAPVYLHGEIIGHSLVVATNLFSVEVGPVVWSLIPAEVFKGYAFWKVLAELVEGPLGKAFGGRGVRRLPAPFCFA